MKYRCLVLDHDDTVVNSTATVHFPSFVQYLKECRPQYTHEYTLEEYFVKNFDPGILSLLENECGLTAEERKAEEVYWNNYVHTHVPQAYDGMKALLEEQKRQGGFLCVVSHSYTENILRDYRANGLPEPDLVYGWESPHEQRKPSPFPIFDLMEKLNLRKDELLVLDDLKPGYDMAVAAGVPFGAAGWAYDIPEIQNFMREHCEHYFESVQGLYSFLFD